MIYACAAFWNVTLTLFWSGWANAFGGDVLVQTFVWFLVISLLVCVQPGPWSLGKNYRWMNVLAAGEIVIISVYFCLPVVPSGVPFASDFRWSDVNYAPIVTGAVLLVLTLWWLVSARDWFTGPRRTIDEVPLTEPRTPGAL